MKKRMFPLLLALLLLSACGGEREPSAVNTSPPAGSPVLQSSVPGDHPDESGFPGETLDYVFCRIVDGAQTGELVLAQLDYALPGTRPEYVGDGAPNVSHNGRGAALLVLTGEIAVYLDGEPAEPADLEDGMTVEVACCGIGEVDSDDPLTETYIRPVSVSAFSAGTEQNPGGTCYDLCGLYLQVLDDLWQADPALTENISMVGLDLSAAPGGLLDSEKAALAYCFGQTHEVKVVQGTFDELAEQGYFTPEIISTEVMEGDTPGEDILYHWEDGCLFSVAANSGREGEASSLPALFFNASKWRGPLAAYCFCDCTAVWPEFGTWDGYQVGAEMIA